MAILIPRYAQEPFHPQRRSLLIAALEAGVFGAATLPLAARPRCSGTILAGCQRDAVFARWKGR